MKRYVIVGNGVSGTTAAEQIRKIDQEGEIVLLTEEDLPFYSRIRLIDYLSGDLDEAGLVLRTQEWYAERRIRLQTGVRVTGADRDRRVMITAGAEEISYDLLLLATGSSSFVPPIIGADRQGTFTLRTIADAREIIACCLRGREVVVIGGGLLGLEAGNALRRRGMQVTVVEFLPRLLPRQLDPRGAAKLQGIMEAMGFSFQLGISVHEIQGGKNVERVVLDNCEVLPADLVLIAAGVRPNLELARCLGLDCNRGVLVDEMLRTSRPGIYAAGDVAEFKGNVYGSWLAALQQGKIAGANMAGGSQLYRGTVLANKLKVAGIDLAAVGEIDADGQYRSEVVETESVYRKMVYDQNDRLIGAVLLGDTSTLAEVTRAVSEQLK
ncbi:MAG: NAD(P)/FAD-dependent oxidoreductase [Desulfobulbaceae bacterium]